MKSRTVFKHLGFVAALSLGLSSTIFAAPAELVLGVPANSGDYLVKIAGCADCHSTGVDAPFAGGVKFTTPFGTLYSPNITPDKETGIGTWDFNNFKHALRDGVNRSHDPYYPVFPYRAFTKITDEDLQKMWDYLQSIEPIHRDKSPSDMITPRWTVWGWMLQYFRSIGYGLEKKIKIGDTPFQASPYRDAQWNRGAYIAEALAHCTECHTPRDFAGGLKYALWMAGSELEGVAVPNITPDVATGRGSWSAPDWDSFLLSGRNPKTGVYVGHQMAQVIQNTAKLTDADRAALVVYLRALEPIQRGPRVP